MFLKYVTTLLFVLNIVLIYLLSMYYLNCGVIHIYFVFFVFLGFLFYGFLQKYVNFKNILPKKIAKYIYK